MHQAHAVTINSQCEYTEKEETNMTNKPRPDLAGQRYQYPGQAQIYLIDVLGTRRWIPNPDTYNRLFRDWNGIVQDIDTLEILAGAPISSDAYLAQSNDLHQYKYLIDGGHKRWIDGQAAMDKYYFNWNNLVPVDPAILSTIPDGQPSFF